MGWCPAAGSCLLRTRNVADPTSWRGWSGTGFTVTFPSPYLNTLDPAEHVCAPATRQHIGTLSESLGWSTYFKKWVLVGAADNADGVSGPGFYFFTSDDLINWSPAKLLMKAELPWTWQCADGPRYAIRRCSIRAARRNFDTMGQRPYLFFTRFNIARCASDLDRDLIRIPIEFSNQAAGRARRGAGGLDAAAADGRAGDLRRVGLAGRRRVDHQVRVGPGRRRHLRARHRHRAGGEQTYDRAGSVTVTVRVSDDDGKATDETGRGVGERAGRRKGRARRGAGAVGRTSAAAAARRSVASGCCARVSGTAAPWCACASRPPASCGCARPRELRPSARFG